MIYALYIKTRFELKKPITVFNAFTRCRLKYDHAAVLFEENRVLIIAEMKVFTGYTETPYTEWLRQYKREIVIEELQCSIEDVRKHRNKKYDKAGTFWALPIYIISGVWVGRVHIADRKLFCFELIAILKKEKQFWLYLPAFKRRIKWLQLAKPQLTN